MVPKVRDLKEKKREKKYYTIWSFTPSIGMPDPITSKEDDAKARRCFVGQISDFYEISA